MIKTKIASTNSKIHIFTQLYLILCIKNEIKAKIIDRLEILIHLHVVF